MAAAITVTPALPLARRPAAARPRPVAYALRVVDSALDRLGFSGGPTGGEAAIRWTLALAGELRAGSESLKAIRSVHEMHPVAPRAAAAARVGADVPAALREDAAIGGVMLLRSVAACWLVGQRTGAGLAEALENLADGYRRTLAIERTVRVEMAAPRATARIMSLLPVLGIGLATLLGANPIAWLTSTPLGLATLVAGVALNAMGAVWTRRLSRRMELGR